MDFWWRSCCVTSVDLHNSNDSGGLQAWCPCLTTTWKLQGETPETAHIEVEYQLIRAHTASSLPGTLMGKSGLRWQWPFRHSEYKNQKRVITYSCVIMRELGSDHA